MPNRGIPTLQEVSEEEEKDGSVWVDGRCYR